mmetsp:Transcript_27745/g.76375  ORF Transcript_27745/g.76375 Transcript_27745/m.76375 type:complete len:269 (-) Transcript_27745:79-885(-)
MPAQRRASFSVVDRLPNPMSQFMNHGAAQSVKEEDAVGTAASTVSGDSGSRASQSSPRKPRRRSLFQRTLSKLTLNMLLDDHQDEKSEDKSHDGLLGASTGSITSFEFNDMEMSSFEMEMKARSLLTDVRQMLKTQKQREKELETSIRRQSELALARSSGVGALISMKKAKKEQAQLKKVQSAIGYLDTQQMDLMMDLEEAKNKSLQNEEYDWPVYEDFPSEVENILSPTSTKEESCTDDQLMLELETLRRAARKSGSRKAARHHSMD